MARIVKLVEILPEDIAFEMPGGQRYTFPGDPPLDLILKIASLFEQIENKREETGDDPSVGIEVLQDLDNEVIKLLQMRDPSVTSSPFGVIGVQHVVAELLAAYNFGEVAPEGEDPPKPTARSTRSSGSRSSSRRSASPRTTGVA